MTLADALTSTGRWNQFAPFTALHLVTVTICLAAIAALVLIGCSLPDRLERRLRLAMAVLAIAEWTIYNTAWNWAGLDPRTGLPLHICDIGGLLAPFALLTQNRWLRATLYFWAFALTTQAFIQPTLTAGPSLWLFWCFWTSHTIILGYAIYDLAVLRFRPSGGDFGRATVISIGYFAVVMPVNVMLSSNYAFIGNPTSAREVPPFVAALGPWPGRVFVIIALVMIAFLIVLLPWQLRRPSKVGSETAMETRRP